LRRGTDKRLAKLLPRGEPGRDPSAPRRTPRMLDSVRPSEGFGAQTTRPAGYLALARLAPLPCGDDHVSRLPLVLGRQAATDGLVARLPV